MDQATAALECKTLLQGRTTGPLETVFVFGRARGDWEKNGGDSGILETASRLWAISMTETVCIPGTPGGATHEGEAVATTYPGPEVWREYLEKLNIRSTDIVITAPAPVHTRGDSDSFVVTCKERNWTSAAIIMQPHQTLRAMLAMLMSMKMHSHHMDVVPIYPEVVNWSKMVYGSQGAQMLPRHKHIKLEWERTLDQQEKGWLASFEDLRAYLMQ